jgi:hypothetical protein
LGLLGLGQRDQPKRLARLGLHHLSHPSVLLLAALGALEERQRMAVLAALGLGATLILAAEVAEVVPITLPSPEGRVAVAFLAAVALDLEIVAGLEE